MNYPISRLRRGMKFTSYKRNLPRFKRNTFASTRSLALRQSQLLSVKDHFFKSNTKTFRTLGAISLLVLGFVIIDSQISNVQTQVSPSQNKNVIIYKEVSTFVKQPAPVVVPKPEEKPIPVLTYQVVDGDTLTGICIDIKVDCSTIITLNNLQKPYSVFVGQKIRFQ
jgi:hypothetical protein